MSEVESTTRLEHRFEYVLVYDDILQVPGQEVFLVPLLRAYLGTPAMDHPEGLWIIVSTPSTRDDFGPYLGDVTIKLPAMLDNTTGITVNRRMAEYLDVGYVLMQLRVIE